MEEVAPKKGEELVKRLDEISKIRTIAFFESNQNTELIKSLDRMSIRINLCGFENCCVGFTLAPKSNWQKT
ncbi:hypothetical protein CCR75_000262 [Bremia lactucae]|uniref:Uncharacterized protein n=1 Tax=Bremia lactucae TaxID=4779 RepID=A0A976FF86_BRELC|nr:hypothetical protein CCR75_000262 [Bremia lactucae]